jgi:hypothetical protein
MELEQSGVVPGLRQDARNTVRTLTYAEQGLTGRQQNYECGGGVGSCLISHTVSIFETRWRSFSY